MTAAATLAATATTLAATATTLAITATTAPAGASVTAAAGPGTPAPIDGPLSGVLSAPRGGYWTFSAAGQVSNVTAPYFGSMAGTALRAPIVGMSATPSGDGYWMVGTDGGVFSFGRAAFKGSMGATPLAEPIVGMATDPATGGYWMVASDGGVFSFTAPFYGSMGGTPLHEPIVGMAATPTGGGYWMVASDGGVFAFGNAAFKGSMGATPLAEPIVGMASDPATGGYWMVGADGGVFSFTAPFYGATGANPFQGDAVGITASSSGSGYRVATSAGLVYPFGTVRPGGTTADGALATAVDSTAGPHPILPPDHPPADIAPSPAYYLTTGTMPCWQAGGSGPVTQPDAPSCIAAEVQATDAARAPEGLPGLSLPDDFTSLTTPEQLFVITDAERTARGLAPFAGLTATLDTQAQSAAEAGHDPTPRSTMPDDVASWGANLAQGVINPLDANYVWMYQDGWGGAGATFDASCTGPTAPDCWGHRDNILTLADGTLVMGAGAATTAGGDAQSLTELFECLTPSAPTPPFVYTWQQAVAAGA